MNNKSERYCECGCKKEVKNRFVLGHNSQYRSDEANQRISESKKGRVVSLETRKKLSIVNKGKILSEEVKKKISESNKGKINSKEHNRKISEGNKGRIVSEETRKKSSISHIGKTLSEETKRKIGEAQKGKIISEETKKKMSKAKKGKKISEEARKKISEGNKGKIISEETRAKTSASISKLILEGKFNFHNHFKTGYYKGNFYRSSWEFKAMKYFDRNNIVWQYEPKRFYLKELKRYYVPDFYLPDLNKYIEIKGRIGNPNKFKIFQKECPNIKSEMWMREDLVKMGVMV